MCTMLANHSEHKMKSTFFNSSIENITDNADINYEMTLIKHHKNEINKKKANLDEIFWLQTSQTKKSDKHLDPSNIYEKLATLSEEPERVLFLNQLFAFMDSRNTPINILPAVCRQTVDLYKLYLIVKNFGGLVEVTKVKQWRDVSATLGFGGSSSAGFTLKRNYCKYLFPFECKFDRNDIDPTPILISMETPAVKKEAKKKSLEKELCQDSNNSDEIIKTDCLKEELFFSNCQNGIVNQEINSLPKNSQNSTKESEESDLNLFKYNDVSINQNVIKNSQVIQKKSQNSINSSNIPYVNQDHSYINQISKSGSKKSIFENKSFNTTMHYEENSLNKSYYQVKNNDFNYPLHFEVVSPLNGYISESLPFYSDSLLKNTSQQFQSDFNLRYEKLFPCHSIESIKPSQVKPIKITSLDLGKIDKMKLILALNSGLIAELTWALDCLLILSNTEIASDFVKLDKSPALLESLAQNLQTCLSKIFGKTFSDFEMNYLKDQFLNLNNINPCNNYKFEQNKYSEESMNDSGENWQNTLKNLDETHFNFGSSTLNFSIKRENLNGVNENLNGINEMPTKKILVSKVNKISYPNNLFQKSFYRNQYLKFNIDESNNFYRNELFNDLFQPDPNIFNNKTEEQIQFCSIGLTILNILCNLSAININENSMAKNIKLISILSKILLYNHYHIISKNCKNSFSRDFSHSNLFIGNIKDNLDTNFWLWEFVKSLRLNSLIIFSYISRKINLAIIPSNICLLLSKGLIHWSICFSSEAIDLQSDYSISGQRLALESLCKLSFNDENVNYIIATPPFSELLYFIDFVVDILYTCNLVVLKEMIISFLYRFIKSDSIVAKVLGLQTNFLSIAFDYLERYEKHNKNLFLNNIRDEQVSSDLNIEIAIRISEIIKCIVTIPDNLPIINRFKDRLISLTISESLDINVSSVLAFVLSLTY